MIFKHSEFLLQIIFLYLCNENVDKTSCAKVTLKSDKSPGWHIALRSKQEVNELFERVRKCSWLWVGPKRRRQRNTGFLNFSVHYFFRFYLTALNVGMIIYFLTSSYASNPKGLYGSPYPSRINMDFWLWILSRFHMLMSVVLNNCRLYGWKVTNYSFNFTRKIE